MEGRTNAQLILILCSISLFALSDLLPDIISLVHLPFRLSAFPPCLKMDQQHRLQNRYNHRTIHQPEPSGTVEGAPPYDVQPEGAALWSGRNYVQDRVESLGYFSILPDELLMNVLEYLSPISLMRIACTSKYLRAFALHEELWMQHCEHLCKRKPLRFLIDWKTTFITLMEDDSLVEDASLPLQSSSKSGQEPGGDFDNSPFTLALNPIRVYSDYLYNAWFYSAACIKPKWLLSNSITEAAALDPEEFRDSFEKHGEPVILKGLANDWPACKLWRNGGLRQLCGHRTFKAGAFDVSIESLEAYSYVHHDQKPLYIFDKHFAEKFDTLGQHYS